MPFVLDNTTFSTPPTATRDSKVFYTKLNLRNRNVQGGKVPVTGVVRRIADGFYVFAQRDDIGFPAASTGSGKYINNDIMRVEVNNVSVVKQNEDYFNMIKKIFEHLQYVINTVGGYRNKKIADLFKSIQERPIIGYRTPSDLSYLDAYNSIPMYSDPACTNKVGNQSLKVLILPPRVNEPLNTAKTQIAVSAPRENRRLGQGSYAFLTIHPQYPNCFRDELDGSSFVQSQVITMLHELTHVLRVNAGLSRPYATNSNNVTVGGAPFQSAIFKGKLPKPGGGDYNYEFQTDYEEIITFGGVAAKADKPGVNAYIKNLWRGTSIPSTSENPVATESYGYKDFVLSIYNTYAGINMNRHPELRDAIVSLYKGHYASGKFTLKPALKSEFYSLFEFDETSFAKALRVKTRSLYSVEHNSMVGPVKCNILNDSLFTVENGLPVTIQTDPNKWQIIQATRPARPTATLAGSSSHPEFSIIFDNAIAVEQFNHEVPTVKDIDKTTIIDEPNTLSSPSVANNPIRISLPDADLNTAELTIPDQTELPSGVPEPTPTPTEPIVVSEITAPMIPAMMTPAHLEDDIRLQFNDDSQFVARNLDYTYLPKGNLFSLMRNGADQSLGIAGYIFWLKNVFDEIQSQITQRKFNASRLGNTILSIIPFYAGFRNLSPEQYTMSVVTDSLSALSIFRLNPTYLVVDMVVNTLYNKLLPLDGFQIGVNNYIEQFNTDIQNYKFENYNAWKVKILNLYLNESYLGLMAYHSMILSVEQTFLYDANHSGFNSEQQMRAVNAARDKTAELKNLGKKLKNTHDRIAADNALQIYLVEIKPKIKAAMMTARDNSMRKIFDKTNEAYSTGVITQAVRDAIFQDVPKQLTISMADLDAEISRTCARVQDNTDETERNYPEVGVGDSLLHIDSAATPTNAGMADLFGNYQLHATGVDLEAGREGSVLTIRKEVASPTDPSLQILPRVHTTKLPKNPFTIRFWAKFGFDKNLNSTQKRKIFSYVENGTELFSLTLDGITLVASKFNRTTTVTKIVNTNARNNVWTPITILASHNNWVVNEIEFDNDTFTDPTGDLLFFADTMNYSVDNIRIYPHLLNNSKLEYLLKSEDSIVPKDYSGNRLRYGVKYYLRGRNFMSVGVLFNLAQDHTRMYPNFSFGNNMLYYRYIGTAFMLENVTYPNKTGFVEKNDQFFIKVISSAGNIRYACIKKSYYSDLRIHYMLISSSREADAEKFQFIYKPGGFSSVGDNSWMGLRGTGPWSTSPYSYRGTGAIMNLWGYVSHYPTFEFRLNDAFEWSGGSYHWSFVKADDPQWIEPATP